MCGPDPPAVPPPPPPPEIPKIEFPKIPPAPKPPPPPPPSGRVAVSVEQRLREKRRERSEGNRTGGSGRPLGRRGTVIAGNVTPDDEQLNRRQLLGG